MIVDSIRMIYAADTWKVYVRRICCAGKER